MDNDNDLDIYLTSRPDSFYLGLSRMVSGKRNPPDKCRDKLYRNDNGKFTEIGKKAGISHNFGYALSVVTADLNNDGIRIFLFQTIMRIMIISISISAMEHLKMK